jgi:hypothetical protein
MTPSNWREEARRYREALVDALDGLCDMRPYVRDRIAEQWEHDGYIDRARAALIDGEKT